MSDFSESSIARLQAYCRRDGLNPTRRLGFGKDGSVWATAEARALKVHDRLATYTVERNVYWRLNEQAITEVAGHALPELLAWDDELAILEMSIVKPPFVLDFASAQLDHPFDFPDDIMHAWLAERLELFGPLWPRAAAVLRALERYGIFMLDVHPGNIRS